MKYILHLMLTLLLLCLGFPTHADDKYIHIQSCKVNFKKDFTIYVDYGNIDSDFDGYVPAPIDQVSDDDNGLVDDDTLSFVSDKKHDSDEDIMFWSEDQSGAEFYDPSVDDESGVILRFDYRYNFSKRHTYYGEVTYYVYKKGSGWSEGEKKELETEFTSHHAYVLIEHNNDELHNLRCGGLDKLPPKDPQPEPEFELDICPYVPNTLQTNNLYNGNPYGALQTSATNLIQVADNEEAFFLSSATQGTRSCVDSSGNKFDCKVTNQKPPVDGFPKALGSFPNTGNKSDIDCKRDNLKDCYLEPGVYKDVKIAQNASLVLSGGQYYFNILKFEAENASLEIENPTEINYRQILFEKSGVKINTSKGAKSENLLFIGHGKLANFYLDDGVNNALINAYVYVDKAAQNADNGFGLTGWHNTLNGGVTSHSIAVSGGYNRINATNNLNCLNPEPTPEISAIKIDPQNIYLQCESNAVYVDVSTVSGDAIEDIGDTRVVLESAGNIFSFSNGTFDPDKQRFKFDITSKSNNNYGEFKVDAYLAGNPNIKDTNHLIYSPVAFNFNDGEVKQLIAGKQDSLSVQVLACADDSNTVTGNYSKTFSQSDLQNTDFLPGVWAGNETKLNFAAEIKNGQADATIQFNDVGEYSGTLKDVVSCDAFKQAGVTPLDCPEGESKEISGILKFKARPWTFAVCDSDLTALPSGDISDPSSAGFTAAGDKFDIAVLPIRWQSGGSVTSSIATQDTYCNASQVTANFAKGEAGTLQIPLAHTLTLPSGGEAGSLSGTTSKSYLDGVNGYYLFNDLNWNEVGQIQLQASTGSYLGMAIQPGYKAVGRFYPKYFKVAPDSTHWDYAATQSFNYMNQPFEGVDFDVEAFDADGNDIVNYRYFESALQAKFLLQEPSYLLEDLTPRLLSPDVTTDSWDSRLTSTLGKFSVAAGNDCLSANSLCWLKATTKSGYEDGPFNLFESTDEDFTTVTNIVIADGGSADPIAFRTGEDRLTVQPDLRFGRASLSSVGGVVSDSGIKVPLRLEYWNGSRFITNGDDSSTDVKGSNVVASNNVIWTDVEVPEPAAEVSLSEGGAVSDGISHLIVAKQDKLERQQTQVWLELIDANNDLPWLQYLWDVDSGVEGNPSTVVTFGIYRGNDKIIFRGESGLTGQ